MTAAAFRQRLREKRMIASVKEPRTIEQAAELSGRLGGVFLLTGHIGVLPSYVELLRRHGLPVFLHLEKLGGISTDPHGLDHLVRTVRPDGIISTKTGVIRAARKKGLLTVQRFFLVDTDGLANLESSLQQAEPDFVELMPARMPDVIARARAITPLPIITGGLLQEPEQGRLCLAEGAAAISSSRPALWKADYPLPPAAFRPSSPPVDTALTNRR
ncbi:glycerol-3-phosphate responsive antiterminator [Paenibacillus albicereus]|uniref:Glycerol-3-phosphate responsive antiterminator n=1 Tax=Paenibacillus albicereus TaxID=2726185 RepID=A0A6H2GV91_9BACL|nr:glycerol-3-phosphate responsive antiterminator [Paenibacillus albicereus]QJC51086.1 glycerol-3-phosphate responsive antiterminator [Paenibacillus albicereus]